MDRPQLSTSGIDFLIGSGEAEILRANGGPLDQLRGGGGGDIFAVFDIEGSRDVIRILDFDVNEGDAIDFGGETIASIQTVGSLTYILLDGPDRDTVIVNGALPPELSLADGPDQAEGDAGATLFSFTVTRSGDLSGESSATWTVTGTGASPANAADFVGGALPSGTVTFAAGADTATIEIPVQGDVDAALVAALRAR